MGKILLAYGLSRETIAAIIMFYNNLKVEVHSQDGDTDFFDIVTGVLQGNTLAPYQLIICLDYILQMLIDEKKWPYTKRQKTEISSMNYVDDTDDIAFLANIPTQTEFLLHNLKRAVGSICEHRQNYVHVL